MNVGILEAAPRASPDVQSLPFQSTLAKALYDNQAECSDELAFRRGDILMVLEQNLLGSEGWWKCSLHGKQGLAPANRLQLLTAPHLPSTLHESQELAHSPWSIYQVPSAHRSPAPLSVYEKMDGWIAPSLPPPSTTSPLTKEVYQVPPMAAKLLSEKTKSSSKQGIATLPSSRKSSRLLPHTERQVYDTPVNPEKARTHIQKESSLDDVYVIPSTASRDQDTATNPMPQTKQFCHYNTLPNLRKSEWIYDIPVSPEKTGLKPSLQNHFPNKHMIYDIPPARFDPALPKINNEGKLVTSERYDIPPAQRKLTLPEIPLYAVPSSHDCLAHRQNDNYDIPSAILTSRIEKENDQQILYDVPKGIPIATPQKKETNNNSHPRDNTCICPLQLSTDGKRDQDRLSISSVDSRTSTLSTLSSSSADSFSSSSSSSAMPPSSGEPSKESTVELESAIETLTKLQHSVSSSVASLMIFVSSRWRYQEHLEGNIEEIHRAVDHIKVSLGEFLDFAQTVEGSATQTSDIKLQARIKKQLSILTDSFQILVETRQALNNCKWSLDILVIKKPQNNPDNLDRFVMVARTIPEDIKRFVSIVIANGKLLFRKTGKEKASIQQRTGTAQHKMAKYSLEHPAEDEHLLRNSLDKSKENSSYLEKSEVDISEECDYTQIQNSLEPEKTLSSLSTSKEIKKNTEIKRKGSVDLTRHDVLGQQDATKQLVLSDLCRLYFGAVQKAISVFHKNLTVDQAPEVFIANSKLIIMVGQKLVDTLCEETLEKTGRNEILCCSSRFCGLLKSLAVATKNAAVQYPSPEAMKELQDQAGALSKYTQQFRAMME
uniref:Cas scaffold protein family member 4 n=1 Tax=Salvator merianae TaxID=96440 RepID=A0A8D0BEQ0_SALMN